MITKTYLDGKLNQLEEKLRRRIDMKDERVSHEIEADIANLKNSIKLLEEKIEENKDLIRNYVEKQNGTKQETEKIEPSENKDTAITSDF
ncbi:MAG: hypothetical protein KAQ87_00105 [Candidatus Pacebacteria bacterium]|nr:hypothetical protein [Candidatus Paceibacterota bacterium]